ncbi:response regulator transcription factor [Marispirochaeta sp.]|jgi:DNA-binding NarL/FixJ family response regulator|uniref:response regulator transcription factor n=1 Tax=Marispirochaeta sp. TaxID=2038653 RepID=UPI0029C6707E|nr:response regulator transcription factor [Marispirochaeta sp.]
MKDMIRIVIADDQKLFADNLHIVLESRTEDIKVVGIAYNGKEAVEIAEKTSPHIILMDVRMPVMDGVEALSRIKKKNINTKTLMLTTFDDDKYVNSALAHGAVGYLLKISSPTEIISSIRAVFEGSVLLSPKILENIIHASPEHSSCTMRYGDTFLSPYEDKINIIDELTAREMQIVNLISLAYDNKKIGEELGITEQTVKNYISKIFMKLGISKRTQLMRVYIDWQSMHKNTF